MMVTWAGLVPGTRDTKNTYRNLGSFRGITWRAEEDCENNIKRDVRNIVCVQ